MNDPANPVPIEPPPYAEGVEDLPESEEGDEVISDLPDIEELSAAR